MAAYTFETITAAQAIAFSLADTLSFTSIGADLTHIAVSFAGSNTVLEFDGRRVTFGGDFSIVNRTVNLADGTRLVFGTTVADVLTSTAAVEGIYLNAGNDSVVVGAGDRVAGGAGSDTFFFTPGVNATITDWSSDDRLVVNSVVPTFLNYVESSNANAAALRIASGEKDVITYVSGLDVVILVDSRGDNTVGNRITLVNSNEFRIDSSQFIAAPLPGAVPTTPVVPGLGTTPPAPPAQPPLSALPPATLPSPGQTFVGTAAADLLVGGGSDDTMTGLVGNDQLGGLGGNDSLVGGEGLDRLTGGAGQDWVDGGLGDDTILGNEGNDTLVGGDGIDTLSFEFGDRGVVVDLTLANQILSVTEGIDAFFGFENLIGNTNSDYLAGDAGANRIDAGLGNNTLIGGGGDDTLQAGGSPDLFFGGDGNDRIVMDDGDTITSGAGNDLLVMSGGIDNPSVVTDWSAQDRLIVSVTGNYAESTAATYQAAVTRSNELVRAGNEYVSIQVGADVYVFGNPLSGRLSYADAVRLVGRTLDDIGPLNIGPVLAPPGTGAGPQATAPASSPINGVSGLFNGNMDSAPLSGVIGLNYEFDDDEIDSVDSPIVVRIRGFGFDTNEDFVPDNGTVQTLYYKNGPFLIDFQGLSGVSFDTLQGWATNNASVEAFTAVMARNDSVRGGGSGDMIRGYTGDDALAGGGGDDTLYGGVGNDFIFAQAPSVTVLVTGSTFLRGEEGNDYIVGGSGFDDMHGNMGNDTLSGGAGEDWVVGGKDNDALYGGAAYDLVYGNIGNDTCEGGEGNDIVRGGQDNDVLGGWSGDDFMSGDRGNDTLTGGTGADTFSTFGEAGIDLIRDFNIAEGDRIQLAPGTVYTVEQVGANAVINMVGGGQVILEAIQMNSLTGNWIFGA